MTSVDYVVRDATGSVLHGTFPEGDPSSIYVTYSRDISLNMGAADVASYERVGNDLVVTTADGQQLVLNGYYDTAAVAEKNLYLSENGEIVAVNLADTAEGVAAAEYIAVEADGKWSVYDDLLFLDLDRVEPVVAPLAAPLISPLAGLLAGGAALAGTTLLGGDDGNGGGGIATPTVDDAGETYLVGGTEDKDATVSGTGEPGSEVVVTIGDQTQTTTIGDDGTWETTFDPEDLPDDGVYPTEVTVTDPEDTEWPLEGPTVDIDTTPPDLALVGGVESTGDLVNGAEHEDGAVIEGTGEPGADVVLEVNGYTYETTIADDGTWSVTLPADQLPEGEYSMPVTATATDERGNSTVVADAIVVDTIPPDSIVNPVETDDVVNAVEAEDGVTVQGTGEPGATIVVETAGDSRSTTVAEDGTWSVDYTAEEIGNGVYDANLTVTSTDAAGNSSVTTHNFHVDTEVMLTVDPVAGDNVIDGTEAAAGFSITGTGEPGATVTIEAGDDSRSATVAEDGSWSIAYGPGEVASGTYDADLLFTSTDIHGNVISDTLTIHVDTETVLTVDPVTGDNVIDGAEAAAGVTVSGRGEPGSTVTVDPEGAARTAIVAEDGTWSVDFGPGEVDGGTYDATLTIVATDALGNNTSTTATIHVDTETSVTLDESVGGDGVLNAAEAAGGVTLTGTAEAGASVAVDFQGVTRTVSAGADGTWSAAFSAAEVASGEYDAPVSVTATDAVGNTATTSGSVRVDTQTAIAIDDGQAGDGIVNAAEAASGVAFTGTVEPGAAVEITVEGVTRAATVDADGNWTAVFEAGTLPEGEYQTNVTATATDAAGNSASATAPVLVDTTTTVALDAGQAGGDDLMNGAEAAAGVTLSGTAEPGATVEVTVEGATRSATAGADGTWAATFEAGSIPGGEYDADVSVVATDVAGNTATTSGVLHVDTQTEVSIDANQAGGDDVVNAAENDTGIVLTGAAEPGSAVNVTVAGVTIGATVAADGSWTAAYGPGALPAGEYDTTVEVSSTDAAGNTASASQPIRIDTVAGEVALSELPIEIDDIINDVERSDGVVVNGTATPGLTVTVTLGDADTQVVADGAGTWSVTFPAADIPEGTATLPITASITDAAGNSASVSDNVALDTVLDVTLDKPIEGDNVVNATERADGVTLSGTVEPGSTVMVEMAGMAHEALVDDAGVWTVDFAATDLPEGTTSAAITVTATDAAGNVAVVEDSIAIDTDLALTSDPDQTADDVLNTVERSAGVTLTGTVEAGASVTVAMMGIERAATVDASGNWSVAYTADEIPEGTYEATATVTATDTAGNSTSLTETFGVDTEIDTPDIDSVTFTNQDVWRISTQDSIDSYSVNTLETDGTIGTPESTTEQDPLFGTEMTFNEPVSDGTNLVVSRVDDAGNSAATLVVLEDGAGNSTTLDHPGVADFDVQAINLEYGEGTNLVLSEADVRSLSSSSNTLTIHGSDDDTVTVSGATDTGETRTIDGDTYNIYTLGDDGTTLVIEDDINVII